MRHGLPLLLALAACAGNPEPSPATPPGPAPAAAPTADDPRIADIVAFQTAHDRALADDPVSFLTAVAAHYLAPGATLALRETDGTWGEGTGGLQLVASADALRIEGPGDPQTITDRTVLELDDRWRLAIAKQSGDWRVMLHDSDAPARTGFHGTAWFPPAPELVVAATYTPATARKPVSLLTSRGISKTLYEAGTYTFAVDGQDTTLTAFGYAPDGADAEPLLIPFRDATTGTESYGAGRYLEPTAPPAGETTLDFNRATNPLCAYSEHYNCPFPPPGNKLPFPVRAGARDPGAH